MKKELKVGIIGLGHLHPFTYMPHFKTCPYTQVVAATDPKPELREAFSRQFGVETYAAWQPMLDREKPDLVYIFLPHCDCAAAAIAAAERGIHVVVEKPVAHTSGDAARIAAACKENKDRFCP